GSSQHLAGDLGGSLGGIHPCVDQVEDEPEEDLGVGGALQRRAAGGAQAAAEAVGGGAGEVRDVAVEREEPRTGGERGAARLDHRGAGGGGSDGGHDGTAADDVGDGSE